MSSVLKSFALCACFGLFSITALGQGAACSADGENAKGSPIACVTGEGVQVKAATTTEPQSSDVLPLAPEQRPASRPVVIYQNGKLTIMANNATLGDILDIVGEKTGAVIDVPEPATERVVSQLGPGLPRDVIASLLNGSHFNYVVVGTETDENAVSRVVLTAKTEHADTPAGPANGRPGITAAVNRTMMQPRNSLQQALAQANQVMLQEQPAQPVQTPDFQQPPVASASETPAPVGQASASGNSSPTTASPMGTETAAIDQPSASDGAEKSNGERTPQQTLQDLYETRRQMMQQQQPKPQQPAQ